MRRKQLPHGGRQFLLNPGDELFLNAVHVVPKALAGQLRALDAEQARQNSLVWVLVGFR
jgi:hypothetical protein